MANKVKVLPKVFEIIPGGEEQLFYSESEFEYRCIGHLRSYFDRYGDFGSTWWPHEAEDQNTQEFKSVINDVVDYLRRNMFKGVGGALDAIHDLKLPRIGDTGYYGCHIITEKYSFFVRLLPNSADYSYTYCYVNV